MADKFDAGRIRDTFTKADEQAFSDRESAGLEQLSGAELALRGGSPFSQIEPPLDPLLTKPLSGDTAETIALKRLLPVSGAMVSKAELEKALPSIPSELADKFEQMVGRPPNPTEVALLQDVTNKNQEEIFNHPGFGEDISTEFLREMLHSQLDDKAELEGKKASQRKKIIKSLDQLRKLSQEAKDNSQ